LLLRYLKKIFYNSVAELRILLLATLFFLPHLYKNQKGFSLDPDTNLAKKKKPFLS
jgi:hypothetical protein